MNCLVLHLFVGTAAAPICGKRAGRGNSRGLVGVSSVEEFRNCTWADQCKRCAARIVAIEAKKEGRPCPLPREATRSDD